MDFKSRKEFEDYLKRLRDVKPPSPISKTTDEIAATLITEILRRVDIAEASINQLFDRIEKLETKIAFFFPKSEILRIKEKLMKVERDHKEIMSKSKSEMGKTACYGNDKEKKPLVGEKGLPKDWKKKKK